MVKICMKTKKKYEKPQMEIYNVRRTKAALLLYSGGAAYLDNESNPVVWYKCLVQFQGPIPVPFFYLCGHGFNSEENRQALV